MRGFENHPSDWVRITDWVDDADSPHRTIAFAVAGQPIQKGNIVKSKWGAYHDATKGIGDWVSMVQTVARAAMNNGYGKRMATRQPGINSEPVPIILDAVRLEVELVRQRLKGHPKKSTPQHIKTPDLDKLVRGICDGLTGIVYKDDCQVVEIVARKRYAQPDERPGAAITITSGVVVE